MGRTEGVPAGDGGPVIPSPRTRRTGRPLLAVARQVPPRGRRPVFASVLGGAGLCLAVLAHPLTAGGETEPEGRTDPSAMVERDRFLSGEVVVVTLVNGSGTILVHHGPEAIAWAERRGEEGWERVETTCGLPHCLVDIGPPSPLPPRSLLPLAWPLRIHPGGQADPVAAGPGTWRLAVRYRHPERTDWDLVRTVPFTIVPTP